MDFFNRSGAAACARRVSRWFRETKQTAQRKEYSVESDVKISVIIPTLNEAGSIEQSISSIGTHQDIEIVIVDGGSQDNTVEIAQNLKVKVLIATGGRAVQMNIGAELATGEILLFLHADTILPPNFATMVREVLISRASTPIAGAFRLQIDAPQWRLRLVEWGVNYRSKLAQMPYGDQAIFLTAETFQRAMPMISAQSRS